MSGWSLGEPFTPALSDEPIQFLLRGTDGDMDGIVYPASNPATWVPGDNSRPFAAEDLREISNLLDGVGS